MFDDFKRRRDGIAENNFFYGHYAKSYFEPFKGKRKNSYSAFTDAKRNAKAIVLYPVIDIALALQFAVKALQQAAVGFANIAVGMLTLDCKESEEGFNALVDGIRHGFTAIYGAISAVTDCLDCVIRFITHSLATVAYGISSAVSSLSSVFTSCSSEREKGNAEADKIDPLYDTIDDEYDTSDSDNDNKASSSPV